MSCPQADGLDGYFDGELDAVRAAEFEAHLPTCGACTATLGRRQALRAAITSSDLYAPASRSLHARVQRALRANRGGTVALSVLMLRRLGAAAALLAIAVGGVWWHQRGTAAEPVERATLAAILDAHVRSLQPGHLSDVSSSDQHTVRPWFDGRLDYSPPVVDLAAGGFPLIGGRLDVVDGRSVAALVYGRHKHVVNLFVWPSRGEAASAERSGSARGYRWMRWERAGMSFWAVSDTAASDLEGFCRLLQREEPSGSGSERSR